MKNRFFVLLIGLLAGGCASVQVKHVSADDTSEGVHFFEPAPYLLISKTIPPKKDNAQPPPEFSSQIIYLPDPSQRYSVKIHSGWGAVDGSVKLINGWMLDSLGAKSDSKMPETITALTGVAKLAAAGADSKPEGLYRIRIDKTTGKVWLEKQEGW